jgi:hypothetical protein
MAMEKKCIIVIVPKEYHKRLKKEAAEREVSVKILVLRGLALLLDHTEKEDKND